MAAWRSMLGALLVWAGHFFTLYILASVFGTSAETRIGTAVATLLALGAAILLLRQALRSRDPDPLFRWMASVKALAAALVIVAVLWQAMPALLG
jgi:hypothetical protein